MTTGTPIPPATRAEVMALVEASWTALDSAIAGLDDHQLSVVPSGGGWSIKDTLAHIAAWKETAVALLSRASIPIAMGIDPELWKSDDTDRINEAIEDRWRNRSGSEVVRALHEAEAQLRELMTAISDEDLALPSARFQPESHPYLSEPVAKWIADNTYGHIDEHLSQIEALRREVA